MNNLFNCQDEDLSAMSNKETFCTKKEKKKSIRGYQFLLDNFQL